MSDTPSPDQSARQRIRDDLQSLIFVEAGAGTGKTTELIWRVIGLVRAGVHVSTVAAITFTQAAADELKDRLRRELELAAAAGGQYQSFSPADRERCAEAASALDSAAIQTLHSFARSILALFPIEAGLPPQIDVQDEVGASIAFEEHWSEFVESLLSDPALREPLTRGLVLGLRLYHLRAIADGFHRNWDRLEAIPLVAPAMVSVDVQPLLDALERALDCCPSATDPSDLLYQYLLTLKPFASLLREAAADLAAADSADERLSTESALLRLLAHARWLSRKTGQKANWQGITPTAIQEMLGEARDLCHETVDAARRDALLGILPALRAFVLDYAADRRRAGALEFHDLLVLARDLLRDDPVVRYELASRYRFLLVDEFQDTDPIQAEIAGLLVAERQQSPASADAMAPLFVVGDPKQSIYRFRRADIAMYEQTRDRLNGDTVFLTHNYRSRPGVLRWINAVFAPLFDSQDPLLQAHYQPLHPARAEAPGEPVLLVGGEIVGDVEAVRREEACALVRVVESACQENWLSDTAPSGQTRYADITLLIPARRALDAIERAFELAGIPVRVESRALLFDTPEVRSLVNVLAAIDDPTDDVAVVGALRSPAFACGDDDLARFRRLAPGWDYRQLPSADLERDDPVVAAMAALHAFHERRWWEPLPALIESVIRERCLLEVAFAGRRPRETWRRLRYVQERARAFIEHSPRATLRQFVAWLQLQADERSRVTETAVPEPDDDAVRIMTIHASKGLQFPIVILAGLNTEPPTRTPDVLFSAETLEVSVGNRDGAFRTAGFGDSLRREREAQWHERVRLLYVAATRAQERLVVSLHRAASKKADGPDHAVAHADRKCVAAACLAAASLAAGFQITELATVALPSAAATPATELPPPDDRDEWIAARHDRIARLRRAPRIAATAIVHGARGPEQRAPLPGDKPEPDPEAAWRRGRAGTSLGRAVHAVLQTIDLATAEGLAAAARAQATAEGLPDRQSEVERLARAALESPAVRAAVASGRFWREVYVAAPIGEATIEGFIDLLYESPEGLVIVDYKTDAVRDAAAINIAMSRYRLQGAAYAMALEVALGRPVARSIFVFVNPREERAVDNLPAAIAEVKDLVPQVLSELASTPF